VGFSIKRAPGQSGRQDQNVIFLSTLLLRASIPLLGLPPATAVGTREQKEGPKQKGKGETKSQSCRTCHRFLRDVLLYEDVWRENSCEVDRDCIQ
jgi:hypothetical protein